MTKHERPTDTPSERRTPVASEHNRPRGVPSEGAAVRMAPEKAEELGVDPELVGKVTRVYDYVDEHPGSKYHGQGDAHEPHRVLAVFEREHAGRPVVMEHHFLPGELRPAPKKKEESPAAAATQAPQAPKG